ncbi:DUF443 family protein [Paraliobacillus sp. JSM ZJ581]|uniref:DUF443 family protein n=1 Tax=Paraliobacillus sp. JSM ZJ581 TaxID=3342118 RepID=UPI0035A885D5
MFFLLSLFILIIIVLRLYISNKNKKAICELVNLNSSKKERIWLKPESFKHCITIIVFYSSLVFFSLYLLSDLLKMVTY